MGRIFARCGGVIVWTCAVALSFGAITNQNASAEVAKPNVVISAWELDLQWNNPKIIQVKLAGESVKRTYWYMPYTVTNNWGSSYKLTKKTPKDTDSQVPPTQAGSKIAAAAAKSADLRFIPDVILVTDAGDVIRANKKIPAEVFAAIKKRERNPLLLKPIKAVGKILQGKDNAKDSVMIWETPKHDVNSVKIFFSGLSGETHRVARITDSGDTGISTGTIVAEKTVIAANAKIRRHNEVERKRDPNILESQLKKSAKFDFLTKGSSKKGPKYLVLRKSLFIHYKTPGGAGVAAKKPFVLESKSWILR